MEVVCDCGVNIDKAEMWILKDLKDFVSRKLIVGSCPKCHRPVATLIEKRIDDGQVFINSNLTGNDAVKLITKEQKRFLCKYYRLDVNSLFGWLYGVNVGIKNKKGEVTQIRQYASNFNGNKKLVKKLQLKQG